MNIFLLFLLLVFQSVQLFGGYRHSLVMGDSAYSPYCVPSSSNFSISFSGNSLQASARARQEVNRIKQSFAAYVTSMRYQPGYEAFILDLYKKIQSDTDFRYSLEYVPGFNGRTGFLNYVGDENKRIKEEQVERERIYKLEQAARKRKKEQECEKKKQEELKRQQQAEARRNEYKQYRLKAEQDELAQLIKKYQQKADSYNYLGGQELLLHYRKRIEILREASIRVEQAHDYSSEIKYYQPFNDHYGEVFKYCYGTSLDKQLHEELCETRSRILELSVNNTDNFHVRVTVPMMSYYTALAKVQKSPTVAFSLADFADELTRVISKGIRLVGKGALAAGTGVMQAAKTIDKANAAIESGLVQAVKTTLDPQHWKDLLLGTMDFWIYLSHESAKEERRQQAMWTAALTGNTKYWHALAFQDWQESLVEAKAFDEALERTKKQIQAMPWDKLLEKGVAVGATLVLDGVALHAASKFASAASRQFVSKATDMFNQMPLKSKEHLIEIAGVGKLVLEAEVETASELAGVVDEAATKIKTEGTLFNKASQESGSQAIKKSGGRLAQERGKVFEDLLVQKLGGRGSFKITNHRGTREFDGAIGNVWYEAKSGKFWEALETNKEKLNKFKSDMMKGFNIARDNGACYELYSNTLIPESIKNWLTEKGINFTELIER